VGIAIASGDILACRAWVSTAAQAAVNTYNMTCISVTGGGVTDQDLAAAFDAVAVSLYAALCPTEVTYNGIQVYFQRRTPMVLPNPVKSVSSAGPCTGTGGILPTEIAAVLKYKTANRGPAGRGRVYLPFIAGQFKSAFGVPTTAMSVLVNSFASAMLSPLVVTSGGNTATLVWSLMRRELLPAPPSSTQILQAESAEKFGQIHRRGDYGKLNLSPI